MSSHLSTCQVHCHAYTLSISKSMKIASINKRLSYVTTCPILRLTQLQTKLSRSKYQKKLQYERLSFALLETEEALKARSNITWRYFENILVDDKCVSGFPDLCIVLGHKPDQFKSQSLFSSCGL